MAEGTGGLGRVGPGVRAITAPNPSPMTFTGTRTYVVGEGAVAVIDPGPADPGHLAALLAGLAPGERVGAILVTHSHTDHSPGARLLAEATGAPVFGFGPHGAGMSPRMRELAASGAEIGGGEGADRAFRPDRPLADGETVETGGAVLEALHTPGHLSNHLAFAMATEAGTVVFTGDAVMGWATTLVSPPEGDMAAQMATLRRLAARRDARFLPGHGDPVEDPAALLAEHIAHREKRRAALVAALGEGPAGAPALARRLYTDTDPRLLPAAARNVLATLLQLEAEGVAEAAGPLRADVAFRLR